MTIRPSSSDWSFFVDQYDEKPPPQKFARSRIAYIFRTGQPMVMTEEIFQQLVKEGEVVKRGEHPPASWLGVPATPAGVIGVLVVQNYSNPEAYDDRDLKFSEFGRRPNSQVLTNRHSESWF